MLDNSHIERVSKGDRLAFKELHEELYQRMFYYVYKMLRDKEQAEDIIQEAFVLYLGNRVNFNNLLAVKTYLFTVVRNKVMVQIRDEAIHKRILEAMEWEESETEDHLLVTAEICGEVQRAVKGLPAQTRRVIELSMEDMTVEKIAVAMQISPNTVKTLKKAGYQVLREKLKHLRGVLPFLFIG
ncbi:MAG TPA: sigma-70 family RNA polymerase sigma factor [Butyricimonas virosa]|uniref:Sigma-70 family RNA polymerase sigma factor n=1 Tax=Butyricimonas virosa TaxID=544645 RepID=A0A921KZ24_9BACT|nr:sigma-70 family RNA polymerase sigma factor [Butyricimonas virosa]